MLWVSTPSRTLGVVNLISFGSLLYGPALTRHLMGPWLRGPGPSSFTGGGGSGPSGWSTRDYILGLGANREMSLLLPMQARACTKRRRLASCGTCPACTREDCGRCINCIDKPKFGGDGVRKQSCIHKRCSAPKGTHGSERQPLNEASNTSTAIVIPPSGLLTPVTSAARAKGRRLEEVLSESLSTAAVSIAIPANTCSAASGQEDPLFWTAVQALLSGVRQPASCTPQPEAATITDEVVGMVEPERCEGYSGLVTGMGQVKRMRSARCGMCPGCKCGDCGQCKNCLDKPAFGGPGCRKQACMMRTCSMPWLVDDKDSSSASPANFT